MSDWTKIDSDAALDDAPAASAVPTFLRRNLHASVESRHIGSGMAYDLANRPTVGSGTDFTVDIPFLVPPEKFGKVLEVTIQAEAFDGSVLCWLVIDGEQSPSGKTFTVTGSDQVKTISMILPSYSSDIDFHRVALRLGSTRIGTGAIVKASYFNTERLDLEITSGTWPTALSEGKCNGELDFRSLSSGSAIVPHHYFGARHQRVSTATGNTIYQVLVWPFLGSMEELTTGMDDTPLKDETADLYIMSTLAITSVAFEFQGSTDNREYTDIEPMTQITANTILNLTSDAYRLRAERSHWFTCSFPPRIWGTTYNCDRIAVDTFGGMMAGVRENQTPISVASFPAEVRHGSTGLRIGILWTQIGQSPARTFRIKGQIGGVNIVSTNYLFSDVYDRMTSPTLFAAHGTESPLVWGTEDGLAGDLGTSSDWEIGKLQLSVFDIGWPSALSPGDLVNVELTIDDQSSSSGRHNTIHLYALSAIETFPEG